MQELYRFQKHSTLAAQMQGVKESTMQTTPAASQATEQVLPPLAPPVTVYANLPIEWPLARISVYMRHVSVLLRVTLNRRLAELSFRGVDFQHLPREVVRHTKEDFDTICGAMADAMFVASALKSIRSSTCASRKAEAQRKQTDSRGWTPCMESH